MFFPNCPICQKANLKEVLGKKAKRSFARFDGIFKGTGSTLLQCEGCQHYFEMTVLASKRTILELIPSEKIVDATPKRTGLDLEQYLKSNGWHKIYTENKEFVGWWHPEISPQHGKVYPPWAAQIIQNGIDDFIYSHLKH